MSTPTTEAVNSRAVFCTLETYSLVGGLQNFNKRVVRNLIDRSQDHDRLPPHVITLRDSDIRSELGTASGRSYSNRLSYFAGIASAIRSSTEVLILGHVNLLPVALISRVIRPSLPVLLIVHGEEVWNTPNRRTKKWYEPFLLRLVDQIASVSKYTAEIMSQEFRVSSSKFRLLPNAVDPLKSDTERFPPVSPMILTVTRLGAGDRPKNVDQMLKAVAILKGSGLVFRYMVVGDGALRGELEQLARELKIDDIVDFMGRVDDESLRGAYARASVFALPSSKEGFGIVYLEAWLHAIPVICSSKGASSEIVTDGVDGYVVPPDAPHALADRLKQLLSDATLSHRMGVAGRDKVRAKYLNTAFRNNLDAVLDDLGSQ